MKISVQYILEAHVKSRVETYHTDATRNSGRKCAEDVHGWAQPFGQSLVTTVRFVELSNFILKDSDDGVSRVAILELGGKRMRDEVFLRLLLVRLQGSLKDSLEVRGT